MAQPPGGRQEGREGGARPPPLPGVRPPGATFALHERSLAFDGKIFKVVQKRLRLPNGHETMHEVIEHPGAVTIIPLLEGPQGTDLVLVEQFRSTVEGCIHEVPAGTLDPGEDPLECARRELLEETGYAAESWTRVATIYPTPGIAAERMHYFLAQGLRLEAAQSLDEGECLTVKRVPLRGLLESMTLGKTVPGVPPIVDGKTYLAVFYLGARLHLLGEDTLRGGARAAEGGP